MVFVIPRLTRNIIMFSRLWVKPAMTGKNKLLLIPNFS